MFKKQPLLSHSFETWQWAHDTFSKCFPSVALVNLGWICGGAATFSCNSFYYLAAPQLKCKRALGSVQENHLYCPARNEWDISTVNTVQIETDFLNSYREMEVHKHNKSYRTSALGVNHRSKYHRNTCIQSLTRQIQRCYSCLSKWEEPFFPDLLHVIWKQLHCVVLLEA